MLRFIAIAVAGLIFVGLPALADPAAAPEDLPGVSLTITGQGEKSAVPDLRVSRLVALSVPASAPPSSFTPPGPFTATFEGDIAVRLRTFVNFSAEGQGKLSLSVGGKTVLESEGDDLSKKSSEEVRLGKGKNHFVATYTSPPTGAGTFRLTWSSKSWPSEPVPTTVLTHATSATLTRSLQVREGRFLFTRLRCGKCHTNPAGAKAAMPELAMDAPNLSGVGSRLNPAWLAGWIADPHAMRPGAHMPRLFPAATREQASADVATYLASFGNPTDSAPAGDAREGGRVVANLDCIACHTTPDGAADPSRISWAGVAQKFRPAALREFLLHPHAHYVWNPMPDFHLTEAEANAVASYLLTTAAKPTGDPPKGDPGRGKTLVQSTGCLNCHALDKQAGTARAPALADLSKDSLTRGCLAADATSAPTAPDFALTAEERSALVAFLETDRASLSRDCAAEFADRQIKAMRCTACHARDGIEASIGQSLEPESQALHQKFPNPPVTERDLLAADQRPPQLTWTGEKLRPQWMRQFIAGQIAYKPRYYLRARMPAFPPRAEGIAAGLIQEHGVLEADVPPAAPDPKQAEVGRTLSSKVPNQGFSCVQCHAVADTPPFAAFEAPSINFRYITERIRHDYYTRWMQDPQRIDPNTKMPKFSDPEGKSGLAPFDNDAGKQFEAIWQYLLAGSKIEPPPG